MPNLIIHLIADALLIGVVYFYKPIDVQRAAAMIVCSNFIDIDHLLADPIYDPSRCGINFHPLHSWYMYPVYGILSIWGKYQYFFWGVILHLVLDYADCFI